MGGASRTAHSYASQTATRNVERARATARRLDQAARARSTPIILTNDNARHAMISTDWVPQRSTSDRIAAAEPQIRSKRRARSLAILAFRLAAAASTCFATPGAAASAGTSVPSPVCIAADLRLMTLI